MERSNPWSPRYIEAGSKPSRDGKIKDSLLPGMIKESLMGTQAGFEGWVESLQIGMWKGSSLAEKSRVKKCKAKW